MRMMIPGAISFAALALAISAGAAMAGEVTVHDGWMRALPSGLPAGGYFTLHNGGDKTLVLTGATSPACGMLMLHKSENIGGMTHMGDAGKIEIPAGGTLSFKPGGYHLMCTEPTPAIKPGGKVPVTLDFADGSHTTAEFAVRSASGR